MIVSSIFQLETIPHTRMWKSTEEIIALSKNPGSLKNFRNTGNLKMHTLLIQSTTESGQEEFKESLSQSSSQEQRHTSCRTTRERCRISTYQINEEELRCWLCVFQMQVVNYFCFFMTVFYPSPTAPNYNQSYYSSVAQLFPYSAFTRCHWFHQEMFSRLNEVYM